VRQAQHSLKPQACPEYLSEEATADRAPQKARVAPISLHQLRLDLDRLGRPACPA